MKFRAKSQSLGIRSERKFREIGVGSVGLVSLFVHLTRGDSFPDPSLLSSNLNLPAEFSSLKNYYYFLIWAKGITQKPTRGTDMDIKYGSWMGAGCLRSDQLLLFYWSTTSFGFATATRAGHPLGVP